MQDRTIVHRALGGTVTLALIAGLGIGSAYLYHKAQQGVLFQGAPPPRIDAAMIKGAWLNVVPKEDATVAIAMGRCLDVLQSRSSRSSTYLDPDGHETRLQNMARHCESSLMLVPKKRQLARQAVVRRQKLTDSLWPDEPPHKPFSFSKKSEIKALWNTLAETPQQKAVALFLQECLDQARTVLDANALHGQAAMCENRSAFASGFDAKARDELVATRKQATGPGWPEYAVHERENAEQEIPVATTAPGAPGATAGGGEGAKTIPAPPAVAASSAVNKTNISAAWADTTDPQQAIIAAEMTACLMGMADIQTGVVICELKAMNRSPVADQIIDRRVGIFPDLQGPGKRFDPAQQANPVSSGTTQQKAEAAGQLPDGDSDRVLGGETLAIHINGAQDILNKWSHASLSPAERAIGARLVTCLENSAAMTPDNRGLQLAVDTCKLRVQLEIEREAQTARELLN